MNLYEAVYGRKSIRKFRMEPVNQAVLNGIYSFVEQIEPLFPGIRIRLEIVDNLTEKGQIKGMFRAEAPYYLLMYTEDKEKSELNAGYIMEHVALYLVTRGVGSCFQGSVKKKNDAPEKEMHFVIAMAFGRPKGILLRQGYDAKRLTLEELCTYKERPKTWVKEILEAARLAPSSLNNQPWRFVVYESRVHIFSRKLPGKKTPWQHFAAFDMGAMLANMMVAAEEIWISLDLIRLDNITHKSFTNNQYLLSVLPRE